MKSIMKPSNLSISLITKVVFGILAVIVAYLLVRFFMNTYESFSTESDSSVKTTTVNLYTMVGCGHCDSFKPEWTKLTTSNPNGTKLKDGSVVAYNNYSTGDPAGLEQINADNITGFPTIMIKGPGATTATQYGGPRTHEGIWNFLNAAQPSS